MPFDPRAYLATKAPASPPTGGFDPKSYLASKQPPKELNVTDMGQAGLESFGNAALMGYAPQIQALVDKAVDKFTPESESDKKLREQGFKIQPKEESYVERRDKNIARQKEQAETYPTTAALGSIAGTIATGVPIAKALPLAQGAGKLARIGSAAATGAATGFLQNPGDEQGKFNPIQSDERLQNAKLGGLLGGAIQGGSEVIKAGANALKGAAENRAFKATGAMLKDYRKLHGKDKAQEIGRYVLDKGLVKVGDTYDDIAAKSMASKADIGTKIGQTYEDALSKIKDPQIASKIESLTDPINLRSELSSAIKDPSVMPKTGKDQYKQALEPLIDEITVPIKQVDGPAPYSSFGDSIEDFYKNVGSSKEKLKDPKYINEVIGEIDDRINYSKRANEMKPIQQGLLKLRQTLRDKVNNVIDAVSEGGDKKASDKLKALNKEYGLLSDVSKISQDRIARESANRLFSPSDYGAAGIGALVGGSSGEDTDSMIKRGLLGAAAGLGNRTLRKYGNPVTAKVLDKASKAASKVVLDPRLTGTLSGGLIGNAKR